MDLPLSPLELAAGVLILAGAFFFLAGTVGILRFPDIYSRLHALTKADNLGLGLLALGLALQADNWAIRLQLLLTWLLALAAAATVCHLLARSAIREGVRPVQGALPGEGDPPASRTASPGGDTLRPSAPPARQGPP